MGHGVLGPSFKDQIVCLSQLLDTWSEAEQVVAIYTLIRRLNPIPAKFLSNTIIHTSSSDSADITSIETRANDPSWIGQIQDSKDGGTSDLLQHFPLLRPSNQEAKWQYLAAIPKALYHAISQGGNRPALLENARQLLSYSLIHPGITVEERRTLSQWLHTLEEKLAEIHRQNLAQGFGNGNLSEGDFSYGTSSDIFQDENRWCGVPSEAPQSPNNSATSSRSSGSESIVEEQNTCTTHPGMKYIGIWLKSLRLHKYYSLLSVLTYEELLALDEATLEAKGVTKGARHKIVLSIAKLKERSKILTRVEEDLMSEGNVMGALNELKNIIVTPIPSNHKDSDKYTRTNSESSITHTDSQSEGFSSSFSEMSPASDSPVAAMSGPRKALAEIENDLDSGTLDTEEVTFSELSLPAQFTRVMGKVCTHLLVSPKLEDEAVIAFLGLVDKCLSHEAFSCTLIRRIISWKQQILRIWHPPPPKNKDVRHNRRWSQQFGGDSFMGFYRMGRGNQRYASSHFGACNLTGGKSTCTPSHPSLFSFQSSSAGGAGPSLGYLMGARNSLPGASSLGVRGLLSPQQFLSKRPSLQETPSELRPHVTLHRTRSAPSRPHQLPLSAHGHSASLTVGPQHGGDVAFSSPSKTSPSQHSFSPGRTPTLAAPADSHPSESDITSRLESLCLSMTEHALG